MRKNHLLVGCGLALALAGGAHALSFQPALAKTEAPVAAADLKPDPNVRFGVLPNGMRYQILKNGTPPRNASLRLRIGVGSLYEREDQRGLAHFIEHMVLNGTKNVPEGEMIRRLERAGLKFGPDTNASTDFEQTVYKLDLPQTDAATVDTALFLLREVAGEASFTPSAIESERGIILSEERTRATPAFRTVVDQLGYLLKGDLLPNRLPIGATEVIRTAPRERFVDFYDAYYRPERATLIAVGDFDVDAMEKKIQSQFGSWKGRGKPGAELPASRIAAAAAPPRIYSEPGVSNQITLAWVAPPDLRPDTKAVRTERLIEQLGFQVMNRRFERLAAGAGNPPFIAASASRQDLAERARIAQIGAVAQAGKWQAALGAVEQEQRRAIEFGFTQAEVDREIGVARAALTAAATGAATRPSPVLAEMMVGAVNNERVFTTPAQRLALFEEAVRGLTAQQVTQASRALFAGPGPLVYMTSPTPVEGGEPALLAAYTAAQQVKVAAATAQQAASWPYQSFGTPGAVAERRELAGLGTTLVTFKNGVRLTVKPTKFRDDEILVMARVGNGQLDVRQDQPSPVWALSSGAFTLGGLGKISAEDMQEALSSKVYGSNFGVAEDAFSLSGKTRPEDFATQLQVLAAYVADPGFKASGWDRLRALSGTIQDQLASTPGGVFSRDAQALLHSGDRRWATPTREEMAASSIADAKSLLAGPLQSGPLNVVVVGDITVDEAIRQVGITFGALPPRQAGKVPPAALSTRFPAAANVRATHKGRADQGLAFIAWPTTDFYSDQRRARTLNVLGQVLQLRLIDEIREKQGTTYSPNAGHSASETFGGYGYMAAQIEAPPEKLDTFLNDARKIAADLRTRPITADELERARKPLVENLQRQRASNDWWLSQLGDVQTRPEAVTSIENGLAQYAAITPADLQKAARDYLTDPKVWTMAIVPEAKK